MNLGREIESMELEPLDATPAPLHPADKVRFQNAIQAPAKPQREALPDMEPVGPTVTDPITGEVDEHDPMLVER